SKFFARSIGKKRAVADKKFKSSRLGKILARPSISAAQFASKFFRAPAPAPRQPDHAIRRRRRARSPRQRCRKNQQRRNSSRHYFLRHVRLRQLFAPFLR